MAKSIEVKAKTVDEAILNGLSELGLGIDQVDVEIVQEGKGFLGLGRSAVIRLTEKQKRASRSISPGIPRAFSSAAAARRWTASSI